MTITTTIEVRAVVTVVESPGQTGARQSDGAPLEPSFEREARIASVELPDAEGEGVAWWKNLPTKAGPYWCRCPKRPQFKPWIENVVTHKGVLCVKDECAGMTVYLPVKLEDDLQWAGPIPLPGHATPAHLPVESISPTDAQRILRLAEREEVL